MFFHTFSVTLVFTRATFSSFPSENSVIILGTIVQYEGEITRYTDELCCVHILTDIRKTHRVNINTHHTYKHYSDIRNVMKKSQHRSMAIDGLHQTVYFVEKDRSEESLKSNPPKYKSGQAYTGEWKEGRKHGFGIAKNSDGSKYEGYWKDNARDGSGVQWEKKTKRGRTFKRYEGEWRQNKFHGRGVLFYDNGDKYEGEWEDGLRQGKGTMEYTNGDIYEGTWNDDVRSGVGVLLYANGDRYEGFFVGNKKEGPGRYFYFRTKKVYEGEWSGDMPKCGVYCDGRDEEGKEREQSKYDIKLPALGLKDPDAVLDVAVGKVEKSRSAQDILRRRSYDDDSDEAGGWVDEIRDVFCEFDTSDVGYLTFDEAKRGLEHLGMGELAESHLRSGGFSEISDIDALAFLDIAKGMGRSVGP